MDNTPLARKVVEITINMETLRQQLEGVRSMLGQEFRTRPLKVPVALDTTGIPAQIGQIRSMFGPGMASFGRGLAVGGLSQINPWLGAAAWGGNVPMVAGMATAMAGVGMMRSAIDTQREMTLTRAIAQLSQAESAQLQQNLFGIGQRIPVPFGELSGISRTLAKAGVGDVGAISRATESIGTMRLTMQDMDINQFGEKLVQVMHLFKMSTADIDGLGSALVRLSNTSTASVSEIFDVTQRLAGLAQTMGISPAEVMALATSVKSVGARSESSSTAIQRLLVRWSTNPEEIGAALGTSADKFVGAFRQNPMNAIGMVVQRLQQQSAQGNIEAASFLRDDMGLKNVRDIETLLRLTQAQSMYPGFLREARNEMADPMALRQSLGAFSGDATANFQKLENAMIALNSTVGEKLIPSVVTLTQALTSLINSLPRTQQEQAGGALGAGAGAGFALAAARYLPHPAAKAAAFLLAPFVGGMIGKQVGGQFNPRAANGFREADFRMDMLPPRGDVAFGDVGFGDFGAGPQQLNQRDLEKQRLAGLMGQLPGVNDEIRRANLLGGMHGMEQMIRIMRAMRSKKDLMKQIGFSQDLIDILDMPEPDIYSKTDRATRMATARRGAEMSMLDNLHIQTTLEALNSPMNIQEEILRIDKEQLDTLKSIEKKIPANNGDGLKIRGAE